MGLIIGSVVFMVVVILFIVVLMPKAMDKGIGTNKKSDRIIRSFEPDNAAPELSEMIQYHKKNGIVEYEV